MYSVVLILLGLQLCFAADAPQKPILIAAKVAVATEDPCALPKVVGPCKAAFPRFFYNKDSKQCDEFIYGGCQGNSNNFETKEACQQKCEKPVTPTKAIPIATTTAVPVTEDPCVLPKVVGPCRAAFPRFFYNKDSKQCENFIYGGCQGNSNNFETKDACQQKCEKPVTPTKAIPIATTTAVPVTEDPCVLPKVVGPCRAAFPRFFYNKDSKQCENFIYGGCQGNSNNFETKDACQQKCEKPVTPTKAIPIATTTAVPVTEDPCILPKVVGPCRAAFQRFFYNKDSKQCENFIYGGCQGNSNNFETIEACQEKCKKPVTPTKAIPIATTTAVPVTEDPCVLPKVVGPCRAAFPRFFYNKDSKQCENFIYGGCQGNSNNFETIEACQEKCKKPVVVVENPCALPKVVGPCRASIPRYFFNLETNKCEQFTYGGCQGNSNNFETLEDCQQKCAPAPPANVCKLPSETGLCRAYFERYFFNSNTKKCEIFVYGGCGGNGNNFETEAACKAQCGKKEVDKDDQKGGTRGRFPDLFGKLITLNKKKPDSDRNRNHNRNKQHNPYNE